MATPVAGDEQDLVDGAGWMSDESDDYGSTSAHEELSLKELLSAYKQIHAQLPSVIAWHNRPKVPFHPQVLPDIVATDKATDKTTETVNNVLEPMTTNNSVLSTADRRKRKLPESEETKSDMPAKAVKPSTPQRDDEETLYQLDYDSSSHLPGELIEDFLKRCPPSLCTFDQHGPWLWIQNPNRERRRAFSSSDEAEFKAKGEQLLTDYRSAEAKIHASMPGKHVSVIGKKLNPLRKDLEADIRRLAKSMACLSGKWMLFPPVEDVDRVWRVVCEGVISGQLGPVAKVATGSFPKDDKPGRTSRNDTVRLICVYTKDFSDEVDVRRVLNALLELGLVKRPEDDLGYGIYYKCDAYTHLRIESGNDYKLKSSCYASRDMLKAKR